ncbi:fimbrillin family protein [Bacteroides faecalis]|nr:fimbrillin family protein [Bacteroides faecalis]
MKVHKKNLSRMAGGMATMLLCTLLFSCKNEDFLESGNPEKACDNICFGISSDKNIQTRGYASGNDEGYTAGRFVLRSDNSADTLCVRTIVSDGINVSDFEGEQALTRGVPVTNASFYDKFHVLAYWSKNGTLVDSQFYMDEDATNNGSVWSTNQIYYWPGADHSFQFYAWAPTAASGLTTPSTPQSKELSYAVPADAAAQKDIVVATTAEIQGNNNTAVPLTFKHICTAVRFAVGSQMQPGQIKSVALKGVKNAGTYNMATGTWTLDDAITDFSQTLNKTTTGSEANGDAITTPEGTFMMLPQTLPAGAMVEVVFSNASGTDRTLTASIGNTQWTMGTTVTYKLSITPEYEMNIEVPTDAQDAHYITFPITVNVKDYDGTWKLTSNLTNDVFFTQTKTALQEQGYWINDDKGANTISGTGSGSFIYHVYVTENIGDDIRDLQFQVTPDNVTGATPTTATVQQLCPSWNAQGIGYERIEENNGGNYPFGFKWNRKVVFSAKPKWQGFFPNLKQLFGAYVFRDIAQEAMKTHGNPNYLNMELKTISTIIGDVITETIVTLDYSLISSLEGVTNETDGLENTRNLYFHQGIGDIVDVENQLRNNAVGNFTETVTGGEQTTVENFAARMAVMKNKFTKKQITIEQGGEQVTIWIPEIMRDDIVWYLPASNEQSDLFDTAYPLSNDYWSSTAASDNVNAYIYNSAVSQQDRMNTYKIRAARKK